MKLESTELGVTWLQQNQCPSLTDGCAKKNQILWITKFQKGQKYNLQGTVEVHSKIQYNTIQNISLHRKKTTINNLRYFHDKILLEKGKSLKSTCLALHQHYKNICYCWHIQSAYMTSVCIAVTTTNCSQNDASLENRMQ